jgi:hypothetical protein
VFPVVVFHHPNRPKLFVTLQIRPCISEDRSLNKQSNSKTLDHGLLISSSYNVTWTMFPSRPLSGIRRVTVTVFNLCYHYLIPPGCDTLRDKLPDAIPDALTKLCPLSLLLLKFLTACSLKLPGICIPAIARWVTSFDAMMLSFGF